jgi:ferredoxin-NADP reductase
VWALRRCGRCWTSWRGRGLRRPCCTGSVAPATPCSVANWDSFTQRYPVRVVYLDGSRPRRESWLPAQYAGTSDVAALRRLVPDLLEHEVFLCGPPPWMAAVRATLTKSGVAAQHIHAEEFAW